MPRSASGGRLAGLRARKSDELAAAAGKRAEQSQGLAIGRAEREAEAFEIGKTRGAREDTARKQQESMNRYPGAYQAASFGDTTKAIAILNEGRDPGQFIDGIEIADNGDMMISRRGDVGKISFDRIRRFLPKYPSAKGLTSTSPGYKFSGAQSVATFEKLYDLEEADARTIKAVEDGLRTGQTPQDVAEALGIPLKRGIERGLGRRKEIDEEIADHKKKIARGDKRFGLANVRSREEAIDKLEKERDNIDIPGGLRRPDEGTQTQGGLSLQESEESPQVLDTQSIEITKEFDTNKDGKVDNLDQAYAVAKKAVEIAGMSEGKRKRMIEKFGQRRFAELEALVSAVEKKAKVDAENRVGLAKQKAANQPGLQSLTKQLNR